MTVAAVPICLVLAIAAGRLWWSRELECALGGVSTLGGSVGRATSQEDTPTPALRELTHAASEPAGYPYGR